mmetsp:Transcript_56661/g.176210  ORF Transcript_56661/g.176210 Transcript_56661/m.176210 type:complete len:210 (+) Transcript_56661:281-910(+)
MAHSRGHGRRQRACCAGSAPRCLAPRWRGPRLLRTGVEPRGRRWKLHRAEHRICPHVPAPVGRHGGEEPCRWRLQWLGQRCDPRAPSGHPGGALLRGGECAVWSALPRWGQRLRCDQDSDGVQELRCCCGICAWTCAALGQHQPMAATWQYHDYASPPRVGLRLPSQQQQGQQRDWERLPPWGQDGRGRDVVLHGERLAYVHAGAEPAR